MNRLILFVLLSIPVIIISRKSLKNYRNHGFFRFFGWEGILWMFTGTYSFWFKDFFSWNQVVSSVLLIVALLLLIPAVLTFMRNGKARADRKDDHLFGFEKTTQLVDTGIYRYIRHPMYASLLYLTWGICLKKPDAENILVAVVSSAFFIITALFDERECKAYFGQPYIDYMGRSKRFIPFIV